MRTLISILFAIQILTSFAGTRYYRASFRDDPSTSIVIGWCDDGTSTNATVYYGTTDYGTNYNSYPFTKSIDRTISHRGMNNRFARITNLQPNTYYYFVIKDDQGVSQRMIFKTLSNDPNVPILFISGGDTRTGVPIVEFETSECRPRRQRGNQLVAKIRPDFVAFSGDYVLTNSTNSLWEDWFTDWQLTLGTNKLLIPIVPVFGNHELSEDIEKFFDIPNVNAYFALSFGGNLLRIYNLNSEIDCDATQLNWLTNDLQLYSTSNNTPYWKAVQYHIPLVPHGEYSPTSTLISCWAPLFQQYKVRLAMEGHTHVQKVTWPVIPSNASGSDNGFIRNDTAGTVFFGEGCWGAPLRNLYTYYNANQAFNWTRNQGKFAGFGVIKVTKQKIQIQVVKFNDASDAANVQQVPLNAPPATLPSGLVYWTPSNGQIIEITDNLNLSSNALLNSINVNNGSLNPAFNANTFNYTVQLPYNTTTIPTVTAVPQHQGATVYITQATNLQGNQNERTTKIKVIAENGVNEANYNVEFVLSNQPNAFLSNLTVSQGTLTPPFDAQVFNYSVTLPYGTTTVPTVSATPQDPQATVQITQATSVNGTATVIVTSSDQSAQNTYSVTFSVAPGSAKEIVAFNIPGQIGNTVINQQTLHITVNMPMGTNVTSLTPTITITGVSVSPASGVAQDFTNPVNYTVTAADNSTCTYTAEVILNSTNNDATLSSLSVNPGSLAPSFSPSTTNYTVELPQGTTSVEIFAQPNDPAATVTIYPPTNLYGNMSQRTGIVLVKATDQVTTKIYSILFNVSNDISINNLDHDVKVYPNPAKNKIKIEFDIPTTSTLQLYNGLGHLLKETKSINEKYHEIDLSSLPSGSYILFIQKNNIITRHKFQKL
ncbi:MAG: cadherin-like beta sandwich domain-containing protein [Bacteroidales bacterium]|nr:cadherin-like beta sandwich domain-containing protein [Bacteroidales bacterium]